MKFSIVVPIYNVEDFLPECIESILKQDFQNFELILVDDGSPDSCPQICDEYAKKDSRIFVIHKENGGLSDARNSGLKVAKGDYVCFLDSDDYWDDSSALTKLSDAIDVYQAHFILFGHKRFLIKDNKITHDFQRDFLHINSLENPKRYYELIKNGIFSISACLMVSSRKFLIDNNIYFKKGIKNEDIEWALRIYSLMPEIAIINENFYVYRMQRQGSITTSGDYNNLCDYCSILESSLSVITCAKEEIRYELMSYLMYHVLIAVALCYKVKLTHKERKKLLTRLKVVSKGRIQNFTLDKRVRLAAKIYKISGFSIMAKILGFYLNHRGR